VDLSWPTTTRRTTNRKPTTDQIDSKSNRRSLSVTRTSVGAVETQHCGQTSRRHSAHARRPVIDTWPPQTEQRAVDDSDAAGRGADDAAAAADDDGGGAGGRG